MIGSNKFLATRGILYPPSNEEPLKNELLYVLFMLELDIHLHQEAVNLAGTKEIKILTISYVVYQSLISQKTVSGDQITGMKMR